MDIVTYGVLNKKITEIISGATTIPIHICTSDEYNHSTGIPIIDNPNEKYFYLVPSGNSENTYNQYIWNGSSWELFGVGGGGKGKDGKSIESISFRVVNNGQLQYNVEIT